MTHLIVDASVAFKWFLEESGSDAARSVQASGETLAAPAFIAIELQHALRFAVRGGRLDRSSAIDAVGELDRLFDLLAPTDGLTDEAARLSWTLDHPIYDCLYIALAARENATLVTADDRQFTAARKARVKARIL